MKVVPAAIAVVFLFGVAAPAAAAEEPVTYRFREAAKHRAVAKQTHETSYDRERFFGDWISQGSGCDTRAVVLKSESKVPVTQTDSCTVKTGQWRSYYDAKTYTNASELQIDHVVPVKNVWISGAWQWSQEERVAYYNDLDDERTLVAVDTHDNASKSDQTPDEWLPPRNNCRYVREYVSVKLRWSLIVTRPEKRAIKLIAAGCPNARITYVAAAPLGMKTAELNRDTP